MADDILNGYKLVPEEDRKKAQVFFERGRTVAGTGNYDYGIEMFMSGLALDPDAVDAHQELREISLKRKASGGKSLGMLEAMRLKRASKDDKANMLNAERLMAYDPGNTDNMVSVLQNAYRAGYYDTVMWVGPILQRANADSSRPDINKFITLKDTYRALQMWKFASDAAHLALRMRPNDMDLQADVKNFAALETMGKGKYGEKGSFRDSVKDMNKQYQLMNQDKNVTAMDVMTQLIKGAEAEYNAEPNDPGKLSKYVDALEKTEQPEFEQRAVELLQAFYDKTKQFRFRQRIGKIQLKQWSRAEKAKRAALAGNPTDPELRKEYIDFKKEQAQFELAELQEWAENYPTDMSIRYEVGKRMYELEMYSEAIPVFQTARNDPKLRFDAGIQLSRSFMAAGFVDEADETLGVLIKDYPIKGDAKAKEMYYYRGIALEQRAMRDEALKHFSQVAQWDFNYKDVQARIKKLRNPGA